MNNITKIILSVVLLGTFTLGVSDTSIENTNTIDMQIEEIQNSTPEERVKLMNEFKQELSQMNQSERQAAIEKIQSRMHIGNKISNINAETENINVQSQEMKQNQQMHMNTEMNQMQKMNQNQTVNQINIQQQNNSSFGIHK